MKFALLSLFQIAIERQSSCCLELNWLYFQSPQTVFDLLKSQMTEIAKNKKKGEGGAKLDTSNFMRQFRDSDSLELKRLSAAQFMEVWEHYDSDGEKIINE